MSKLDLLKRVMAGEVEPSNRAERRVWAQHQKREARRGARARARVERTLSRYPKEALA